MRGAPRAVRIEPWISAGADQEQPLGDGRTPGKPATGAGGSIFSAGGAMRLVRSPAARGFRPREPVGHARHAMRASLGGEPGALLQAASATLQRWLWPLSSRATIPELDGAVEVEMASGWRPASALTASTISCIRKGLAMKAD